MSKRRTVTYNQSNLIAYTPVPNLNLPDIEAEMCFRPKDGTRYIVAYCKPKKLYDGPCPQCGCVGNTFQRHGYTKKPRIVHDVAVGIDKIDLVVKVPRYMCCDCGATFSHPYESINGRNHYTLRLLEKIQQDSFIRPFSDIAAETGYTIPAIAKIFSDFTDKLDAERPQIVAPEILSLDEKHIVHNMRAIFVDNQTGRLLEMAEDNKKDTIISVIESMKDYDKNIRVVTTDMANGYRSAIQTCLPNAKIVVDKFHVFQSLHTRISTTKKGIMKNINDQIKNAPTIQDSDHLRAVRDLINGNPYLFKFGRKKISANQKRLKALADTCATFPELNHLRLIKEGVERIYDSATRQEAEARYEDWRKLIPPSGKQKIAIWEKQYGVRASVFSAEFASFDRMMRNWHEEIFAYFDPGCRVTNAVAEGTNNMIQRINAQGSGYGFKHLRAKALYRQDMNTSITYRFQSKKQPIYKPAPSHSGFSLIQSPSMHIVGYKEVCELVPESKALEHHPLSVQSFVDDEAEYYNFDEEC